MSFGMKTEIQMRFSGIKAPGFVAAPFFQCPKCQKQTLVRQPPCHGFPYVAKWCISKNCNYSNIGGGSDKNGFIPNKLI